MDELKGFERSLATAIQRRVGPPRQIDPLAVAARARATAQRPAPASRHRLAVLAAALLVPLAIVGGSFLASAPSPMPSPSPAPAQATGIAVGEDHACAIVDERAWCWGDNRDGQLGVGGIASSDEPVPVEGLGRVQQVSAGAGHTCALAEGRVWCWGLTYIGGGGAKASYGVTRPGSHLPAPIDGLDDVTAVSAGGEHACALRRGEAWCWGHDVESGGGFGTPRRIEGIEGATGIAGGANGSCAIVRGQAWCWSLDQGVVIGGSLRRIEGLGDVTEIGDGASANHVCAVAAARLSCWGDQGVSTAVGPVPIDLAEVTGVATADWQTTCAVSGGDVVCWRRDVSGTLGEPIGQPFRLPGATSVSAFGQRHCAIVGAHVSCWDHPSDAIGSWGMPMTVRFVGRPTPTQLRSSGSDTEAAVPAPRVSTEPSGSGPGTFGGRIRDGLAEMSDARLSGQVVVTGAAERPEWSVANEGGSWSGTNDGFSRSGTPTPSVVRLVGQGGYLGLVSLWELTGDPGDQIVRGVVVPGDVEVDVRIARVTWDPSVTVGGIVRHPGEASAAGTRGAQLSGELSLTLDADRGTLRIENDRGAWQGPFDHVRRALSGWAENVGSTTVLRGEGAYDGLAAIWEQRWWNSAGAWAWEVHAVVIPEASGAPDG